ncbi:tetratricopeptide repeat protein [Williamwhitmania taraxaci]|uniref:Tetratricopeptide repeat-containing protein n=1 Tax=Williamwhitmania taraxaci TaxID=1640674 RepID=A0A1G6K579_9BACT|nr:tetratricopeptide repeat protein [Williamwhitmania taraxaci]SDC26117.1 Tetratricopeptide repeat-containing protein [Williamwhitmania taraxaci]
MAIRKKIVFLFMLLLAGSATFGQQTASYTHPDKLYNRALELFNKDKYAAAQKQFILSSKEYAGENTQKLALSEFYKALCAVRLFNDDAEFLITSFITNFPENQKVNEAYFELAKLRYRQERYADAITWFDKVDHNGLTEEDRAEFFFKLGYACFSLNNYERASKSFFEVKDTDNKFNSPATYYYSHIAYLQQNYATALKGFERLKDDEVFAPMVPYYIVEIYFLQKNYSKVIEYGPEVLTGASEKRAPGVARFIGESYYRSKQFPEALPYLEKFLAGTQNPSRDDSYLVGIVYYKAGDFAKAAPLLEKATAGEDTLSQNAAYHLADCYVKLGDKSKARAAFSLAAKNNFDPAIREDALFNFAKITYDLFYSPFNEAIDALNTYIKEYPNTPRTDEAYRYLAIAYTNTKNYTGALDAVLKIVKRDATINEAIQKVAYFRGLELFQNLNFSEAIAKFSISLENQSYNKTLAAQALYWRGEAYYRLGDYVNASSDYSQFVLSPGSFSLPEFNQAHYGMGYACFKLKDYENAIVWFRKYLAFAVKAKDRFMGDAYNRTGDSYFMLRRFWLGIDYYDKSLETGLYDPDYALFQRGFSLGLLDRPEKKRESLISLVDKFPLSPYVDDALYELGRTSNMLQDKVAAQKYYSKLIVEYPGSSYYVKALVEMGLLSYNSDDDAKALEYYQRVVEEYPGSPEAKNALLGIKNIYVDRNQTDAYFAYTNKLGAFAVVGQAERDSLTYLGAEKVYMSGDCEKSTASLNKYLDEFPNGGFVINANFYLGDCAMRSSDYVKALGYFSTVASKPRSPFSEQALLGAGSVSFALEKYTDALNFYQQLESQAELKQNLLEARVGMLRSAVKLQKNENIVVAADKLLATEKVTEEMVREARFNKAQALMALNRLDQAFDQFSAVAASVKSKEGAESKFHMAEILFMQAKYDKAEQEVFSFAEKNSPHQYWMAKSFILLAQIYVQKNDLFQAKATLQSVIDGYANSTDGIIDTASAMLVDLVKREKQSLEPSTTESDQIKMGQ